MTKPLFSEHDFGARSIQMSRQYADVANVKHEAECPYKPRHDNDNGNEYAMVMAMKEENALLLRMLEKCKLMLEKCKFQRNAYRELYWQVKHCDWDRQEIVEEDYAALEGK